jgi:hypothetical protein
VYIGLDGVEMTILNTEIIALMRLINQDLDTDYGHRKWLLLKLIGYQINYKKSISTNERNSNAERKARKPSKTYVKYRSTSKTTL